MRGLAKWWQRWVLDAVLTRPPPLVAVVLAVFLSVFAIGFWCAHWLDQVNLAAYRSLNVFTDNIKNENLLQRLSSGLPIDVVYTWVNGSDPKLLQGLNSVSDNFQNSCPYSNCLSAPYISLLDSSISKSVLESVPSVVSVNHLSIGHNNRHHNFTVVHVEDVSHVHEVLETVTLAVRNGSKPQQTYWTSDVGGGWGMKQQGTVIVTGGSTIPPQTLLTSLFPNRPDITSVCTVFGSTNVRLLECKEAALITSLLSTGIYTDIFPRVSIKVHQAILMLHPDEEDHKKEVNVNRFEDNEELRYSLRSLEKYAPWVRKIFLVTSGQIPHWLNLDHPRLTIVTHEEIFTNPDHLPTFSSPAIESHIHRIPGLSEHFLYLNDDVMMGSEVWPEDFYSPAAGYKVYLSWTLPECSSGCPGSWLGDGYCDTNCNNTACEWDGGDCAGEKEEGSMMDMEDGYLSDMTVDFCASACSDLWLADRYCDHSCNIPACGYDSGDCGLDNVRLLHELPIPVTENASYVLPKGVSVAWMNISSLVSSGQTVDGRHTDHQGIRSILVNTAQGVLFILLKTNTTVTLQIELDITSKKLESNNSTKIKDDVKYLLTVKGNTFPVEVNKSEAVQKPSSPLAVISKNFTFPQLAPKLVKQEVVIHPSDVKYALVNVNTSNLPQPVVSEIHELDTRYKDGDLTIRGLMEKKSWIIDRFMRNNTRHILNYHKESEWYQDKKVVSLNEVKTQTNSSFNNKHLDLLGKKESEIVVPEHQNKLLNVTKKTGSRSLLWYDTLHKQNDVTGILSSGLQASRKHVPSSIFNSQKESAEVDSGTLDTYLGNLPWEKQKLFTGKTLNELTETGDYAQLHMGQRQLLDLYAESLLHVNRLYNSEYGYQARRVPAHMPHFINKRIMEELQDRFSEEYLLTSSHKIRQANDMQFAFSYFFFLMSEKVFRTPTEVFDSFDTDDSGTLSDREIRTLLTHLYDLPLHYSTVQVLHNIIKNCTAIHHPKPVPTPVYERYADSDLPTVSQELVLVCEPLRELMEKLGKINKYKFSHQSDEAIQFKMVSSNVSLVVHMLDEVRKHPRKFICLNSDLDPRSADNDLIHALVQDTYESLFPVPSSYELPLNYRNRFLYVEELAAWRKWRDFLRALIYASLASLIFLTLINFFSSELEGLRRRWCRRRRRNGYSGVRV